MNGKCFFRAVLLGTTILVCVTLPRCGDTRTTPTPDAAVSSEEIAAGERFRQFNERADKGSVDVAILRAASEVPNNELKKPENSSSFASIEAANAEIRRYLGRYQRQLQIDTNGVMISRINFLELPESYKGPPVETPSSANVNVLRFHEGIRVSRSHISIAFNEESGEVQKVSGHWPPFPENAPLQHIDSTQAATVARRYIGDPAAQIGQADLEYSLATDPPKLYWYLYVWPSVLGPSAIIAVLDASNGEVLSCRESTSGSPRPIEPSPEYLRKRRGQ